MKIFLTFDYELFFGEVSGTVEKCMLQPTNDLFEIAKNQEVHYTFFVDVGYFIQAEKYTDLSTELEGVKAQVRNMIALGHDVQLHIHPHWEKAIYKDGTWEMNASGNYKLSDFSVEERNQIIRSYKIYLDQLIGQKTTTFRAGGWCIQPFNELKDIFKELEIKIDTSVMPKSFLLTDDYTVDFRSAPLKSKYNFEDDVCVENENGFFTELTISSLRYSSLFFWSLYILGRLFPKEHKMIGDGIFLSQGGRKKQVLTTYTDFHVSSDGYYAKKLEDGLQKSIHMNFEEMVVIGHPKANTVYSLIRLEKFIKNNNKKYQFTTFNREF